MPCVQILVFPISDTFASSPEAFKVPLDVVASANGHLGSFYGTQVENKLTGYLVSVWESDAHHETFLKSPSYSTLAETLKAAATSTPTERHRIVVTGDATTLLASPASEIVVFTLKPGASAETLEAALGDLAAGLDLALGAHPPCAWGQSLDDKSKYVLVVGWDTVEAHWEAVKEGTELHKIVARVATVAELSIAHALLTKHEA